MRTSFVVAFVLAMSTTMSVIAGPAAADPLPVPHDFPAGFMAEAINPGGSLLGSNDFSCTPTAEHPRPVVLAHGTFLNRQTSWSTYVPLLKNEGYCVFALTYGATSGVPWPLSVIGGVRPIEGSARELGAFIDDILAATGASKVDIVGHSQGTLMPNYYVKFLGGESKVQNYVSLAPLWGGTGTPGTAGGEVTGEQFGLAQYQLDAIGSVCAACLEMGSGSDFISRMNEGGSPYVPGVNYTNIVTRYDDTISPYTSGLAPGPNTTNIVIQDQCTEDKSRHGALGASPVAAGHVLNALDPQHAREVPCVAVSPGTGAPL